MPEPQAAVVSRSAGLRSRSSAIDVMPKSRCTAKRRPSTCGSSPSARRLGYDSPGNWPTPRIHVDAGAFDSGMDYTTRDASDGDIELPMAWYERVVGEVPRSAQVLARHRPGLLKVYRNRYEQAIRDSLPKQT